ncbi:hypothetical protein ASE41_21665 [Streptomyces sp. Root264]|nr:hypothetical protein ASE41_21665 [Streptomyces sp. Root264]
MASGAAVCGPASSSSDPLSGGANTVAGSGTERSSPASPLVSVPAHGVAPAGAAAAAGAGPAAGPVGTPACVSGSRLPGTPPCVRGSDGSPPTPAPAPAPAPNEFDDAAGPSAAPDADPASPDPDPASRRSGIPSLSAASCNHSGGDNRNDV